MQIESLLADFGRSLRRRVRFDLPAPPLAVFERGTFSRACQAAREGPDWVEFVGNNVLRRKGSLYLFEEQRINLCTRSDDPASWPLGGGATFTDEYAPGPDNDGNNRAGRIVSTGVGDFAMARRQDTDTTAGLQRAWSFWYKDGAQNTGNHAYSHAARVGGGSGSGSVIINTLERSTAWRRAGATFAVTGTPTFCEYDLYADPNTTSAPGSASGDDLVFWGAQFEVGPFPSSTMPRTAGTAFTRLRDVWNIASSGYDARLLSGMWGFFLVPTMDSAQANTAAPLYFWGFGVGADQNYIRFTVGPALQIVQGAAAKVGGSNLTFSAGQPMLVLVDPAGGRGGVLGATAGGGIYSGTTWSWSSAQLNASREDGVGQGFCWMSPPFPVVF